jgi:hypothetical protein
LFLTILGPEAHSELSGRRKWLAALAAMPPAVTTLRILFIGPDLPEALDGRTEVFLLSPEAKEQASQSTARPLQRKHEGGARPRNGQAGKSSPRSLPEKDGWASSSSGQVQLAFIRGAYHAAVANAPLPWRSKPAAAIAFHPGLAEHRGDWEATMEALGEAGVPVGISAYHPPGGRTKLYPEKRIWLRFSAYNPPAGKKTRFKKKSKLTTIDRISRPVARTHLRSIYRPPSILKAELDARALSLFVFQPLTRDGSQPLRQRSRSHAPSDPGFLPLHFPSQKPSSTRAR